MDDRSPVPELSYPPFQQVRRVAIISLHTSPTASLGQRNAGGMNVYINELATAFSERGVATDVFTRRQRSDEPEMEALAPLSRVVYVDAGGFELDKYDLLETTTGFARETERLVAKHGLVYDLVYSHYWLSGAAAGELVGSLDVPWVHTAHTLGLVKNRHLARGARPEPQRRIEVERQIARAADLLVASTQSEAEDIVRAYGAHPDSVTVVPPGVDLGRFRPRSRNAARTALGREGQRLLLFVGRLERLKGVEILLHALALLGRRLPPDVRLLILGEDSLDAKESEKERLRRLAAELGILDRVEFGGSVAHDQLPVYYSAAEACLMPSYSESFGLVGLEAQACGCAVLASNVAGLASVVRDQVTGYLVTGDDPSLYADRIGRLLHEPELAAQMGRRGRLLAQRFSWARTADRLLSEFATLVDERHRVQIRARQE